MSLEAQTPRTPRAPNTAVLMLLVGLVAGGAGGLVLSGLIPGQNRSDAVPDANLASDTPVSRTPAENRVIGPGTGAGRSTGASGPAAPEIPAADTGNATAPAPDPLATDALRAIFERQAAEEARLRERAVLASESPLTPPVTDIAERIRNWREKALGEAGGGQAGISGADGAAGAGGDLSGTGTLLLPRPVSTPAVAPPPDGPPTLSAPTHLLARGSVIPSVLETGLNSDLPGLVRARVSRDVHDTLTGTHVLIPRGAQLVGTYAETARGGQRRLFVTWTDLRLPDGTPVDLKDFSTLGADGAAGVRGRRSTGLLAALGAAVLFDLAGNATQILTGTQTQEPGDLAALLAGAAGNATSRVAERYIGQLIDGGPRFRVAAGTVMNVLVEADMRLPAWEGLR